MPLFGSATSVANFVPDADARVWLLDRLGELGPALGGPARMPHLLSDPNALRGRTSAPDDLDSLFDLVCAIQEVVGQREVELTLIEIDERDPSAHLARSGLVHLGDPGGKLLHPLRHGDEYLLLFTPTLFRVRELLLASIARALGHIALDRAGPAVAGDGPPSSPSESLAASRVESVSATDWDADAELAAVLLGMGIWVANGSYLFENACCGGGCGVDLKSIRTGLSMPEACFALAVDGQRKRLRRRAVAKHLSPTQKAAFEQSWKHAIVVPDAVAIGPSPRASLG